MENNQKKTLFLNTLTSAYNHKEYVHFLQELLNDVQLVAPGTFNKEYSSLSAVIEGHYHIGNYKGSDGKKIALFAVQLQNKGNVENARSTQRAFIKSLLDNSGCDSALAAFYTLEKGSNGQEAPSDKWRLSLIRMEYGFAEGKLSTKLTPAKRYSYLVGKDEPCHTAQERLYGMFVQDEVNPSISDLEEAFSVETVTKQFFNDYKDKYLAVKEYLEKTPDFMSEAERCGFTSEQFTKKLMGQIVFLYFIQKKGWLGVQAFPVRLTEKEYKSALFRNAKAHSLIEKVYSQPDKDGISRIDQGALFALSDEDAKFVSTLVKGKAWGEGPKNFMRSLYESCVKRGKNYFDDYLEPLFYEALNVNRGENGFYARFHCRVPFLNGGLFEQLDNYDWVNSDFHIPNEMFSNADTKGKDDADGILDIFDRYNFTMAEDEPMEREVAIDPEMLGKVFENLLDVKDRKSKGAFYTPREIVHYMCQESLINYLATNTGIEEDDIRKFILYGEYFRDNDCLKTKEIYKDGKRSYTIDKDRDMEMPKSIFSFKTNVNRLKELDELLDNVKIADPAVGSGAFLLGLLNEIVRARQTLTAYMAIEMNGFQRFNFYAYGRKTYDLKVNTIKNCLFACDLEPSATDITKLRLWLSIVIDDETVRQDNSNGMFDAHTEPRQLPNLDCNVICGNSLMDEFEGISLITESSILNNQSKIGMDSFYQANFDNMLSELIKLQDELYFTKDHESKKQIKERIHNIYDNIIVHQLESNPKAVDNYNNIKDLSQQPFILWQLYFPKVFKENQGFDIVIGNPPYGIVYDDFFKKSYEINYPTFKRNNDLYVAFYEKSLSLLKSEGMVSLITPNTFLIGDYFKKLRKTLTSNMVIKEIVDFKNSHIFADPTVYVAIGSFIKKVPVFPYEFLLKNKNESTFDNHIISVEKASDTGIKPQHPLMKKIIAESDFILSDYYDVKDIGFNYWSKGRGKTRGDSIGKRVLYSGEKEHEDDIPFLKGRDIDKYEKSVPSNYLRHDYNLMLNEGDTFRFSPEVMENHEKIIYRQTANKIIATIDEDGIYNDKTIHCIIPTNKPKVDKLYLLGLLNSELFEFIYREISQEVEGRAFSQVKTVYIKQLPIIIANDDEKNKIINNVKAIINKKENNENTSDLEKEIDKIVCNVYGVDEAVNNE